MSNVEAKVMLMLAASDLSISEIRLFFKAIDRDGALEMARRVDHLRGIASLRDTGGQSAKDGADADRLREHESVISQIESLLLVGAALSKSQSSDLLYSEMIKEYGNTYYIPSPNKIAFRLWIARLLDQVPPSKVMHVASKIRNELVHGRRSVSDWPLLDRNR